MGIVSEGVPATSILKHFEKLYDLKLQIEGEGQHLTTLEAVLHLDEKGRVQMGYKRLGEQFSGDPTRALVRYVDKHSPNARSMLLSLVPSLVKKCVYYATNLEIMRDNVTYVMRELRKKEYPLAWWRRRFFQTLRLEGYYT